MESGVRNLLGEALGDLRGEPLGDAPGNPVGNPHDDVIMTTSSHSMSSSSSDRKLNVLPPGAKSVEGRNNEESSPAE